MSRIGTLSSSAELFIQVAASRSVCTLIQSGLEASIQVRSGSLPGRKISLSSVVMVLIREFQRPSPSILLGAAYRPLPCPGDYCSPFSAVKHGMQRVGANDRSFRDIAPSLVARAGHSHDVGQMEEGDVPHRVPHRGQVERGTAGANSGLRST